MLWQVAEIIPKESWGCLCLEWTRGIIFDNIDSPNQNHSTEIHLFPCRDLWPATEFNVTRLHVSFGVPVSLSFVDVLSAGPTCKAGVKNPPSARNNRLFLLPFASVWKLKGYGMRNVHQTHFVWLPAFPPHRYVHHRESMSVSIFRILQKSSC